MGGERAQIGIAPQPVLGDQPLAPQPSLPLAGYRPALTYSTRTRGRRAAGGRGMAAAATEEPYHWVQATGG